jgi:hypothetical protein
MSLDDAEHGRGEADTEAEGDHGDDRRASVLGQHPDTETNVAQECGHFGDTRARLDGEDGKVIAELLSVEAA